MTFTLYTNTIYSIQAHCIYVPVPTRLYNNKSARKGRQTKRTTIWWLVKCKIFNLNLHSVIAWYRSNNT